MNKIIPFPAKNCRHLAQGRCSHYFWLIMQASGKSGLKDYRCILWDEKLSKIDAHWNYLERRQRFGMDTPKSAEADNKPEQIEDSDPITCGDFRLDPDGSPANCTFYFNETCLLKFPECRSICDDYVPVGVQT